MTSPGDVQLQRGRVRSVTSFRLAVVAVLLLATLPKLAFLTLPVAGMDESLLLVFPEEIAAGRVPHRDFFTVYGPGNFTLLAALFAVTGPVHEVVRLVGLAYQVAIVGGVMALARHHGPRATITAGVLSALLLTGPNLLASSWTGGLALTVCSLALLQRGTPRAALVAGVLGGLTAWWRIEFLAVQVAAVPQVWRRPVWRAYAVGFVLGAVPTVVHLVRAGRAMFSNVIVERLGLNAQLAPELVGGLEVTLLVVLVAAVLVTIGLAIGTRTRNSVTAALLSLAILPQALQRVDYHHLTIVACVAIPLAVAGFIGRIPDGGGSWSALPGRAVAGGLLALTTLVTVVFFVALPSPTRFEHDGRSAYVHPSEVSLLTDVVRTLEQHVPPGSRVFMGAQDMSVPTASMVVLYHLLPEYSSDFYYLELPPGVAERSGSPLVDDIESADALVLVEIAPNMDELYYPGFGQGDEDANQAVERGFCPVFSGEHVSVHLPRGEC